MGAGSSLLARYDDVRGATRALAAPLSPEDCQIQSMPDASPTKWHLAHTTWFFETFVLLPRGDDAPFHPGYGYLFNSYYETVGPRQVRAERGLLSRPSLDEVLAYRAHVDEKLRAAIAQGLTDREHELVTLGLHHEQQHQELLLTDVKHALSKNALQPAYKPLARPTSKPRPLGYTQFDGGLIDVGHDGAGFAFDNEGPRHRVHIEPFAIADRPVTCGEYLAFVEAAGYQDPVHWLSDGWAFVQDRKLHAPLYWEQRDGAWFEFTLHGLWPLDMDAPVTHVSHYEADAYARFAGARLPTEFEWEHAAQGADIVKGRYADREVLHPVLTGEQDAGLFGNGWAWTQSAYLGYPRFAPAPGAVGEYNGKFMSGQMVLRGGSVATPPGHVRATYRNFFAPSARWQFTTIRMAKDA